MKLTKIVIHGFGKIVDLNCKFNPQMNVFWGLNEAGKSTLQQAILALLYGFYQGSRARPAETEERERYKPWQAERFGGTVCYRLDDGREFEIIRDFQTSDVPTRIIDPITGKDYTSALGTKRHGFIPAVREHLGMNKEVFLSTAFVRQAQVKQLQGRKPVIDEIVSLLDTGSVDLSAKSAIAILEKKIQEIGTEKARVRKLQQAQQRLAKLKNENSQLKIARQELHQAIIQKQKQEHELQNSRHKLMEYQYLVTVKKIEQLRTQLQKLQTAEQHLKTLDKKAEELKVYAKFPDEFRDTILKRTQNLQNLKEQFKNIAEEKKQCQEAVRRFQAELEKFTAFRSLAEQLPLDKFQQQSNHWKIVDQNYQNAQKDLAAEETRLTEQGLKKENLQCFQDLSPEMLVGIKQLESEIQQLETELVALQQRKAQTQANRGVVPLTQWSVLTGSLILSAGLLYLGIRGIFPSGILVGIATLICGNGIFFYWQRKWRKWRAELRQVETKIEQFEQRKIVKQDELRQQLKSYQVGSYQELLERKSWGETYLQKWEALQKVRDERDKIEFQLLKYLNIVGVKEITSEKLEEVESGFKEYLNLENEHNMQVQQLQRLQREMVQVNDQIEATESSLRQLYEKCGISAEELEAARAEYDKSFAQKRRWLNLQKELEKWVAEKEGILATKSRAELETELQEIEKQQKALLARRPELEGKQSSLELRRLEQIVIDLDRERETKEKQVERLAERIQTVMKPHRARAEIEEEIAEVEMEVRRLLQFRRALECARDTIKQVAETYHRDIAPHLNQAVSEGINHITRGRYREVRIDPTTLSLKLVLPETKTLEASEYLSLGTQEQLYLLLRIAIARLLSESGEKIPLILDDPFVHFDHLRLEQMLNFLTEISAEHQILIFSKEREILRWGEQLEKSGKATVFKLP